MAGTSNYFDLLGQTNVNMQIDELQEQYQQQQYQGLVQAVNEQQNQIGQQAQSSNKRRAQWIPQTQQVIVNEQRRQYNRGVIKELDNNMQQEIRTTINDAQNKLPWSDLPFWDGSKFMSLNVDFQVYKARQRLGFVENYGKFVTTFFEALRGSLTARERQLMLGGEWHSGLGGYNQSYCTWRLIFKSAADKSQVEALQAKLLNGIPFDWQGMKIVVPGVIAPKNSIFGYKVLRISVTDRNIHSPATGKWLWENIISKLDGFSDAKYIDSFCRWNLNWVFKPNRCRATRAFYIGYTGGSKLTFLSDSYVQVEVDDCTIVDMAQMKFSFNRILLNEYYQYTYWANSTGEPENIQQNTLDDDPEGGQGGDGQQKEQQRENQQQDNTNMGNNNNQSAGGFQGQGVDPTSGQPIYQRLEENEYQYTNSEYLSDESVSVSSNYKDALQKYPSRQKSNQKTKKFQVFTKTGIGEREIAEESSPRNVLDIPPVPKVAAKNKDSDVDIYADFVSNQAVNTQSSGGDAIAGSDVSIGIVKGSNVTFEIVSQANDAYSSGGDAIAGSLIQINRSKNSNIDDSGVLGQYFLNDADAPLGLEVKQAQIILP